jgi:hypothetical protein
MPSDARFRRGVMVEVYYGRSWLRACVALRVPSRPGPSASLSRCRQLLERKRLEDDLNETWRIQYEEDRSVAEYTFDYHAEGSDAASEWHFWEDDAVKSFATTVSPPQAQALAMHEECKEGVDTVIKARLRQMVLLTCCSESGEQYTILVPAATMA